jgi:hypothetical protein
MHNILKDPTLHPKLEDSELCFFLTQFLEKYKSFGILNVPQEKAACEAIRIRVSKSPGLTKTRDFINAFYQKVIAEEDKMSSLAELFRRVGRSSTASIDAVKEIYRRKFAASGNTPVVEADIAVVFKAMFKDFDDPARGEPWNAENFGQGTVQSVFSKFLDLFVDVSYPILIGLGSYLNWDLKTQISLFRIWKGFIFLFLYIEQLEKLLRLLSRHYLNGPIIQLDFPLFESLFVYRGISLMSWNNPMNSS